MDDQFLEATISIRGIVRRSDDCVLIVRRSSDDGWELPGGRIYRTESVTDCLHRELREETGLTVTIRRPVEATSWTNTDGKGRFAVYYDCAISGESEVTLSDEHVDSSWVPRTAARDRLSKPQTAAIARTMSVDETDSASGTAPPDETDGR